MSIDVHWFPLIFIVFLSISKICYCLLFIILVVPRCVMFFIWFHGVFLSVLIDSHWFQVTVHAILLIFNVLWNFIDLFSFPVLFYWFLYIIMLFIDVLWIPLSFINVPHGFLWSFIDYRRFPLMFINLDWFVLIFIDCYWSSLILMDLFDFQ